MTEPSGLSCCSYVRMEVAWLTDQEIRQGTETFLGGSGSYRLALRDGRISRVPV